jgi:hypothetical protein
MASKLRPRDRVWFDETGQQALAEKFHDRVSVPGLERPTVPTPPRDVNVASVDRATLRRVPSTRGRSDARLRHPNARTVIGPKRLGPALVALALLAPARAMPAASTAPPPTSPSIVSKETTHFLGPLKPDGTVDYAAALNAIHVKFGARPCTRQAVAAVDRGRPNFLREEMQAELNGEGCFELVVQPQVEGKNMPVEDPTVLWSERDSPFVKVATVTVPPQEFETERQNDFCESLSFSPWHALPAHRPIGGLNRVRKAVYLEDTRYRRTKNIDGSKPYLAQAEPKGWCLDLSGATCSPGP